jgi:hypothetical protein
MTDHRIDARMHEVLDGCATEADRAALERDLAADPALRARYEELSGLFSNLGRIPMTDPPADLHEELMRSIERERARPTAPGWMESLADAFRSRPIPAFAMSLVSVAAVGLLLYAGSRQGTPVAGDLPITGSMTPARAEIAALQAGDASVEIRLTRMGATLKLDIEGSAGSEASLVLEYDARSWSPAPAGHWSEVMPGVLSLSLEGTVRTHVRLEHRGETEPVLTAILRSPNEETRIHLPLEVQ